MEKPENAKQIDLNYIIEYCKGKGSDDIRWLKNLAETKVAPDKNGKERRISFIEIRKMFCLKYMPELMPPAKTKKTSMYDLIESL